MLFFLLDRESAHARRGVGALIEMQCREIRNQDPKSTLLEPVNLQYTSVSIL